MLIKSHYLAMLYNLYEKFHNCNVLISPRNEECLNFFRKYSNNGSAKKEKYFHAFRFHLLLYMAPASSSMDLSFPSKANFIIPGDSSETPSSNPPT